jgi:hypothetical protein
VREQRQRLPGVNVNGDRDQRQRLLGVNGSQATASNANGAQTKVKKFAGFLFSPL